MKLLPYQPADQLVTRADMHAQTTMLRGDMSEMKGTFAASFTEHKGLTQRLFGASIAVNAAAVATAGIL